MNTFDWYYLLLTFPYTLFGPRIPSIWISYGAKCIPILYLIWTIIKNKSWTKRFDYSTKIAAGLVASVIGDVYILNMEEISKSYMINGIIFFALAHIFYISAMKVKNFRYFHLLIVVMLFSLAYIIIHHQLIRMNYWQQITIPAYILIILTMAYRASLHRDSVHIWNHIPATRMAAISFVISDSILGLTEITGLIMIPKYVRHVLILSFYYFSQYCFTKSAILHI
ncbi:lysoplasmalogenase TMEM86A [Dermatophagoides pteronyssinus]|uniref:lysoplasmalogenase n=1 Tax=Dermatophagoides pteronyssinus TaxID=6956 RepID=A0A6P6Y7S8_DERPT|nr:lysoplasmalogenase-like protein TMEM86A [Dermatophagoides pteronyssinus]